MARYQDPLSGLWLEEGDLDGRELSEDYTADYIDRDIFSSFYNYASDTGRAFEHNKMLYGRSAQKISDQPSPARSGATRTVQGQRLRAQQDKQAQMSAAMAGQKEGWDYSQRKAGNKGSGPRVWREYKPPTDFDGSTRGGNIHNLLLRRNRV
jgi:hypothetical protein